MLTHVNPKALRTSRYSEKELEIVHMIAFEYDITEMSLESKLPEEEILEIIRKMCRELDVSCRSGLVRAAFEKGLLCLC